ncbi:unnamed protein product [Bursaphelenchus okinawaensis]|uniref:MFS domain-containing protein n=1 Tax=Bursaphelenchus okinawaensis TaxID=465554 RepID=A0A811LMJ3_9BILA|nr:unnamed protein product [Bursaphelenchus okinawaensis]CAG9124351.1 unnamed protein product [Bursaphelenchus okinawaensis]
MSVVFRHDPIQEEDEDEIEPHYEIELPKDEPPTRCQRFMKKISIMGTAFKDINPPIIMFLVYVGWAFGSVIQAEGIYLRICENDYNETQCSNLESNHRRVEDEVQKKAADWTLYQALAYMSPALVVDTILGAYGDKYGRQINILLGIMGVAVSEYGFLLTLSESVYAPFYITTIFGFFAGMTGFLAMIPVSLNALLADRTNDHNLLTLRAGVLSAAQSLATVVGGVLGATLALSTPIYSTIKLAGAVDIEIAIFGLAFIFVFLKIPQKPGQQQRQRASTLSSNSQMTTESCGDFFRELFNLLKSGFNVYMKKRPGHRRGFMFITVVMLMVTYTTTIETRLSPLLNRYVFRRNGLKWDAFHLGIWNAMGYFVVFIGTFVFLPLFKKVFKFRETTIMIIGVLSSALRSLGIGLATETWHMYIANAVGIFSEMVQPAVVSFIVQLVPADEIGRAFTLFGIAADLAFIITNLVYNNIYKWTVTWRPGFMFEFIGIVELVVMVAVTWVHYQSGKEKIGQTAALTRDTTRSKLRAVSSEIPSHPQFGTNFGEKRHSLFI